MNVLNFIKKTHIGLDLRPEQARLVTVIMARKKRKLLHLSEVKLGSDLFQSGVMPDWQALKIRLSEWVRQHALQGSTLALALPPSLVKEFHFNLPLGLSNETLEKEISLEIKRQWREMREPMAIDYAKLSQISNGTQAVYCVAVPEKYLSQLIACMKACQLDVRIIETEAQALAREVSLLLSPEQRPDYALAAGLAMREVPVW